MAKSSQRRRRKAAVTAEPPKPVTSTQPEPPPSDRNSMRRGAISAFIVFHLVAITCWAVPATFFPLGLVRSLVRPYMAFTGLFQSWDTFAPNPKSINSFVRAVVITQNHHMRVWTFPRMEELSYLDRYRKERYRKFSEVLPDQENQVLLPDVADHLARTLGTPDDPVDKVVLVQFRAEINPAAGPSDDPTPRPKVFYDDYVQQPGAPK